MFKGTEYPLLIFSGNPHTVVYDLKTVSGVFIIPLIFRDAQQNLSALRRKLKGIGKQIYQHLAQTNGIAQQNAFVD